MSTLTRTKTSKEDETIDTIDLCFQQTHFHNQTSDIKHTKLFTCIPPSIFTFTCRPSPSQSSDRQRLGFKPQTNFSLQPLNNIDNPPTTNLSTAHKRPYNAPPEE